MDSQLIRRYRSTLRSRRRWMGFLRFFSLTDSRFGARWHQYRCLPPATEEHVSSFEERWGITLPDQYRTAITQIGDGFGGPFYGVSPLEDWCQPAAAEDYPPDFLRRPFDPSAKRINDLAPGAIRFCNAGCEHYYLMAVSGPLRGTIWHDADVEESGALKLCNFGEKPVSLSEWLNQWLDNLRWGGLQSCCLLDPLWAGCACPHHAIAQVLESTGESLVTVAGDQLPCPACWRLLRNRRVGRVIVTSLLGKDYGNPKSAAILGAHGKVEVEPREAYP